MNNLAVLYQSQGRYAEAEPLYQQALQLSEKVLGKEHPDTIASVNNLAGLYQSQGRYAEAEPLYQQALQLYEKVLGKEHPDTITSVNNLAFLYKSQGRYAEAEPLYQQALQLREKVLGKEHPSTITSVNNLAGLYQSQGRYAEAEPLYQQALQLSEKVLGKEHPDTIASVNNLAGLYQSQGRYAEAEPLYQQALQLYEKVLGKEHPDTITSVNNLAFLYKSQGRYAEAEPLYQQALQLREKVLGKEHPDTIGTQLNLFGLMVNTQKIHTGIRLLKDVERRFLSRSFQELYGTSTEKMRRHFLKSISYFQDMVFSFASQFPKPEHARYAANVMLRWKGVYAEEDAFQHRILHISHDSELAEIKKYMEKLRSELSLRVYHTKEGRPISEIRNELNQAEAMLREKTRAFKPRLEVTGANLDGVMSHLPKGSVLVEFRRYDPVDFKTGKFGKSHWGACLILSDVYAEEQVLFEDLGEADELFEIIEKSTDRGKLLYQYLLGKFDPHIRNASSLYIAPDSYLNLLSFSSLILSDGRYLVQRNQIRRLNTGRDILTPSLQKPSNVLVAMGGVEYGGNASKIPIKAAHIVQKGQLNEKASIQLKDLNYLPHSRDEARKIAKSYEVNCKEGKAEVYLADKATESVLKQMKKAPRILHLSTHGFFLQKEASSSQLSENQPFVLSGLAMANANRGLRGWTDENGEDGLLYALEVLGLNLQGTELVSLSACNTGKGVVDYSEGVYGLVRAFRTAGGKGPSS